MTQSLRQPVNKVPPADLLQRSVRIMLQLIKHRHIVRQRHFEDALLALEALPLAAGEFAQAKANLKNADQYLHRGEPGAARFELQLLLSRLPRMLQLPANDRNVQRRAARFATSGR